MSTFLDIGVTSQEVNAYYKNKRQRDAAISIISAGQFGRFAMLLCMFLGVLVAVIAMSSGEGYRFAQAIVMIVFSPFIFYLPSQGMRRLDETTPSSVKLSLVVSILGIPSLIGIWYMAKCIIAVSKLRNYKPMASNKSANSSADTADRMSTIKTDKRAITLSDNTSNPTVVIVACAVVVVLVAIVSQLMQPTHEYRSNMLTKTIEGEYFSVTLSEEAAIDHKNLTAMTNSLAANGVGLTGSLYKDSLLEGRINILAGCLKYSFPGDDSTTLASEENVKDSLDGSIKKPSAEGYSIKETSRTYRKEGEVYSGLLEAKASKENEEGFVRQLVSMKGNYKCTITVLAPDADTLNRVYNDVNGSFVYKW